MNVLPDDFERADFHFFHVLWETIKILLPRIPNLIKQNFVLFAGFFKP